MIDMEISAQAALSNPDQVSCQDWGFCGISKRLGPDPNAHQLCIHTVESARNHAKLGDLKAAQKAGE